MIRCFMSSFTQQYTAMSRCIKAEWLSVSAQHKVLNTRMAALPDVTKISCVQTDTTAIHYLKGKGKADDLYRGSMQSEDHHRTALQYPIVHWTLCRCQQYGTFSMKALAKYQIILLGEQRHIRCEQLAQGCCPNNAAVGVEPATSWSRVQRPTATPPSHTTCDPNTACYNQSSVRGMTVSWYSTWVKYLPSGM